MHQKDDEIDIVQSVKRILGKKWVLGLIIYIQAMVTSLSSGILLAIVGVVYFLLINATLYPILIFIFRKANFHDYAETSLGPIYS